MRVGKAGIARTDDDLDAARGLRKRLPPRDRAGRRELALLAHHALGVTREARDLRLADLVAGPLGDREHDRGLAAFARLEDRMRHLHVEEAAVAVHLLDLGDALLELLVGRRGVGEPSERIPPRQVADCLPELIGLDALAAVELVGRDLLARTLLDDELHRAVVAVSERLDDECHLRVGKVLLLVGEPDVRRRDGEIGLAVEIAVLEVRFLQHLRLAEEVRALDGRRRVVAHLAPDDERHLDASGDLLRVGGYVLELVGVLEGLHVAGKRYRIVLLPDLRLAAADHGPGVAPEPVDRIYLDIRYLRGPRGSRDCDSCKRNKCFHAKYYTKIRQICA